MSDRFRPLSMAQLTDWIFEELRTKDAIFGVPRSAFWVPDPQAPFRQQEFGHRLDTPFGVAAGPHSQMAQNIIVAWLCGARFIELKTVQTLDELEIAKPCIDMQDEGYNCEWSQELKVEESYQEYLRAWVLIHALHKKLGFPGDAPGIVFNLSVGYNLEGIQKDNVQWYLDRAGDTAADQRAMIETIARHMPEVRQLAIPSCMSDSITLSTMHGCPPGEIESISRYLIEERGLHTFVKLNPTLLGPERLRGILNGDLGFEDVDVPDEAFGHDLKYADAVPMLRRLKAAAERKGVSFGVKLSNTLEVMNTRGVFTADEKMMYLSGRPLAALTGNLAATLADEFDGELAMSYAGGADAFNIPQLLATGMRTITVCTDILKTGGYLRMLQYIERTAAAMTALGARDLDGYVQAQAAAWAEQAGEPAPADRKAAGLYNLRHHAAAVRDNPLLKKDRFLTDRSKTDRKLGAFDCIQAPCVDECPIDQNVPRYMVAVREGRHQEAAAIARADSSAPAILGRICDRKCQNTCIRTHLDEPLAIREIKRFIMDRELHQAFPDKATARGERVAIIGAGPCGVTAASYLARAGYDCTIYEQFDKPGGMVSGTIPHYRLPQQVIDRDMAVLDHLGVTVRYGQKAGRDFTLSDLRAQGYGHVVIGTGAQVGKQLGFEGEQAEGVWDGIAFLRQVRDGQTPALGRQIVVVGAGDVAMDAARTAWRLPGDHQVSLVYRRTISQMPADPEEIEGLIEEGIAVHELAGPMRLQVEDGQLRALVCQKMALGPKSRDGRRRPVAVPGQELVFPTDMLLLAISQKAVLDFFGDDAPEVTSWNTLVCDPQTLQTSIPGVYAGGDTAGDGPSSAVKACADGKTIAAAIRRQVEGPAPRASKPLEPGDLADLLVRRAHRQWREPVPQRPLDDRRNFQEVILAYDEQAAKAEAARCVECDALCSLCVGVCPNLAIMTWQSRAVSAHMPELQAQADGQVAQLPGQPFAVEQAHQVAVLTDFCNECGNCVTFCPTAGRPYVDKPRLYLHRPDFEAERDNAFMLTRQGEGVAIEGRYDGQTWELVAGEALTLNALGFEVWLEPETLVALGARVDTSVTAGTRLSLRPAAEMATLLQGLGASMAHLPVALPLPEVPPAC